MGRRVLLTAVAVLALIVVPGAGAAGAQGCPGRVSPPCTGGNPPPDVNPDNPGPNNPGPDNPGPETPGPNTPGPNTPGPDTAGPNTPGPSVGGDQVVRPVDVGGRTPAGVTEVRGSTTSRGGLPFTGDNIGAAALLGLVLTGTGIGFAVAGRRRRVRLDTAI
jgi:hypothetical protein